ncbi:formate dehydrogenase accessory sulfurtransferase FdhD [Paenibacillus aurantiacus]|uniref:Sulfur carrier protein FdhD n=1 Tax=Paenibacillus aurantiacus TaxID=1936118 RepID=A0ABV5KNW3_9BACL
MNRQPTASWPVAKFTVDEGRGSSLFEYEDAIAAETPFTFRVNGREFATIVCTPADLEEMAYGFLASEGVIRAAADVRRLDIDEDRGFIYAELTGELPDSALADTSKRVIGSCCGKSRQFYLASDRATARTSTSRIRLTPPQCLSLMRQLQESSADFQATGGLHNAALCTPDALLAVRSDIGRHNALDKLLGYSLLGKLNTRDLIVAFSGRLSSEVVLKAAKLGVGVLLSKSAPTDLALELGQDLGVTCVGFIRGGSMNVYTHPERIAFHEGGV